MSEMTTVITSEKERFGTIPDQRVIPWFAVLSLATVMAYADGFWLTSMRGAVGAIQRTQTPFASWAQESTMLLPVFVLAVLGAFILARRWFGPELSRPRATVAAALVIVAAGTVVGLAAVAISSAYDYHLQSTQMISSVGEMAMMANDTSAALALQVRAVGVASAILLVTNLVVVGWIVAIRGGRLDVAKTRSRPTTRG